MKKLLLTLSVLLLSIFVLTSLAACGGTEGTTTTQITTTSPQTTTAETTTTVKTTTTAVVTTTTPTTSTPAAQETVKLMTFNLRYDTTSHPCMSTEVRGAHLIEVIKKYMPDSIGFNEATDDWMNYLRVEMKKLGYEYVGVGRDMGRDSASLSGTGNEHTPVFYRADKYELIDSHDFWLSTTPEQKGSTSWDSACKRICTYAILKNKESGTIYAHFSTHLDHVSATAQVNGVMVIQSYINEVAEKYGDIGIVLSGDFNATRYDDTDPSYVPLTYNTVTSFCDDSRNIARKKLVDGATFTGYQSPVNWENGHASSNDKPAVDTTKSPIDYIFLRKGCYKVSLYTVVDDVFTFDYNGKTWTNHPISDHYGVYCEATFTGVNPDKPSTDESNLITFPASVSTESSTLEKDNIVSENATIKSELPIKTTTKIENLLKADDSLAIVRSTTKKHNFWEMTITLSDLVMFEGLSFKTGATASAVPQMLRVFISGDGVNFRQLGATYSETITAGTEYYITSEKEVRIKYVKLIFSDAPANAALENISVYGSIIDTGKISSSEIELISGPKAGEKEGYEKLFDGDTSTKFYVRLYPDNGTPSVDELTPVEAIIFSTKEPTAIASYTLTNADDTAEYTGRLPREWVLYGSTTGDPDSYVEIDKQTNPSLSTTNYQTFEFNISNPQEYQYYKLVFTKVGTTGNLQFSEINFYEK